MLKLADMRGAHAFGSKGYTKSARVPSTMAPGVFYTVPVTLADDSAPGGTPVDYDKHNDVPGHYRSDTGFYLTSTFFRTSLYIDNSTSRTIELTLSYSLLQPWHDDAGGDTTC